MKLEAGPVRMDTLEVEMPHELKRLYGVACECLAKQLGDGNALRAKSTVKAYFNKRFAAALEKVLENEIFCKAQFREYAGLPPLKKAAKLKAVV